MRIEIAELSSGSALLVGTAPVAGDAVATAAMIAGDAIVAAGDSPERMTIGADFRWLAWWERLPSAWELDWEPG